jgi:hypothetical protein
MWVHLVSREMPEQCLNIDNFLEQTNVVFRFDVLTAVKMSMFVFGVLTPRGLVGRYQRFGGR